MFTMAFLAGLPLPLNAGVVEEWVNRYDGPGSKSGVQTGIATICDSAGNIYVTGYTGSLVVSDNDIVTIKYDSSGTELWAAEYDYWGAKYERPDAIAVDDDGNVYVTGASQSAMITIKYDAYGNELWVQRVFPGDGRAIDIDAEGNI